MPLRSAGPDDEELLRRMLYEALYVADGEEPFPLSILDQPELRRYVEGFGDRDGDIGLVAAVDGVDVGACWCRHLGGDSPGYGWVADDVGELTIALALEARGLGVGSRLLGGVVEALRVRGDAQVSLSVDPASAARRLYERFGFVTVGREGSSITMVLALV